MIQSGNRIPSVRIKLVNASGISDSTSEALLGQGTVVVFSVPGAFTPTCHVNHLPGFVANADKIKAAGADSIVCVSVNDQFVMKAWAEATNALGSIDFIADGNADLAKALGLDKDLSAFGLGTRFARTAMILRDGKVDAVFIEKGPGVEASGAPAVLVALEAANA